MANIKSKSKIDFKIPIVELDGDEMTRVLWTLVKEKLLLPFINLKVEYYDLGIENRERTKDAVTVLAANAIMRYGVGVKCATITPNSARQTEYNLSALYPSPNGTIRGILDGTVFRRSIPLRCVKPRVSSWKKPVIIARHAYGDVYKAVELDIPSKGKIELLFTPADGGAPQRITVAEMKSAGIAQAMHNLDSSIVSFARSCFLLAKSENLPVMFGAKDTISKTYDGRFKDIFARIHNEEFSSVDYSYTLIDDAVAKIMKSEGGLIWACKNYDGDVMSDMVASAAGSLAMMTSVLVSPSGVFEFEAAHGTVQRHYYKYKQGKKTSTNPSALIFAWTGALAKRAQLDGLNDLSTFAERLETATLDTIESGIQTADIAALSGAPAQVFDSWQFIDAVANKLRAG